MVLRYIKFEEKHIPEVKDLFNKYLLPTYYERLGITKQQITDDIIELEDNVHSNVVSSERFRECSLVCVDENNKVIACQLNHFLDEDGYNSYFIEPPQKYLKLPNKSKETREYAEYILNAYNGHDLFNRYNINRVFYLESTIVLPEYRGQGITVVFRALSVSYFTKEGDGILSETQIPKEKMEKMRKRKNFEQDLVNSFLSDGGIKLNAITSNGYYCMVVLNVTASKSGAKESINSKL